MTITGNGGNSSGVATGASASAARSAIPAAGNLSIIGNGSGNGNSSSDHGDRTLTTAE